MDISGWTIAQIMRLPDWVFGNRQVVSVDTENTVADTNVFGISTIELPEPVCIWAIFFEAIPTAGAMGYLRFAIDEDVPINPGEMDAATPVLPDYGIQVGGPPILYCFSGAFAAWNLNVRKGMATDGKKLVVQNYCFVPDFRARISMIVSGLPTSMAGWMAHNK